MDDDQKKKAALWVDELVKDNPDANRYMLEMMVETYILNPTETERVIYSHK